MEQKQEIKKWNPFKERQIEGDPYKTIFVGSLSYSTTDDRLQKEFEIFGPVECVTIVKNKKTGASRGYAFIEFRHERDADYAVMKGDNRKIDGVRVLVDRELGRTRKDWLPRRLGGGKGDARRNRDEEQILKTMSREIEKELREEKVKQEEKAPE